MATIDSNNCIPSGLRADIMRCLMENKNLLSAKGSIHVGTGEYETVGGEKIYKTKVLKLGSEGEVLQVKNGDLVYDKIQNNLFLETTDYSSTLSKTFKSFEVSSTILAGTYSSLKIRKENFSSGVAYTNLIKAYVSDVSAGLGATISLMDQSYGAEYWSLNCSKKISPLRKWTVIFKSVVFPPATGIGTVDLFFIYVAPDAPFVEAGVMREYCSRMGYLVSDGGASWHGVAYPSNLCYPIKIQAVDTGEDVTLSLIYYVTESNPWTLSYATVYVSASQIF